MGYKNKIFHCSLKNQREEEGLKTFESRTKMDSRYTGNHYQHYPSSRDIYSQRHPQSGHRDQKKRKVQTEIEYDFLKDEEKYDDFMNKSVKLSDLAREFFEDIDQIMVQISHIKSYAKKGDRKAAEENREMIHKALAKWEPFQQMFGNLMHDMKKTVKELGI